MATLRAEGRVGELGEAAGRGEGEVVVLVLVVVVVVVEEEFRGGDEGVSTCN